MKKTQLFFVFLFLVFFPFNLTAQETESPFSYGLHLGPSFSGFTNHMEIFSQKKTGLSTGLFCEYKLKPYVSLSVEANYLMEGAFHVSPYLIYPQSNIYYPGGLVYKSSSDVTLHNVDLPVLFKFRPVTLSGASPFITVGYTFNFLITAVSRDMIMTSGINQIPVSDRSFETVTGSFQDWNHGPVAGIGLEFPGTKFKYAIEARYKVGLMDINDLAGLNAINGQYDFSVNTITFCISISKSK
jgi:hypothetical protein